MKYKRFLNLQIFLNICFFQKLSQAHITPSNAMTSDEFIYCDNTHVESQLETLKTGNEFLKLRLGVLQLQMDKQSELWQDLVNKLDTISLNLQSFEKTILSQSQDHLNAISEMIGKQNEMLQTKYSTPAADDKWQIMADIKEIVKRHDTSFENLQNKLQKVEDVMTKASWESHTKILSDNIAKNFTILENIDKKLKNIETETATKINQINLNRNIQKYFSRNAPTKICVRDEDKKLVCTTESYPTNCADFNEKYCTNNKCRIYNHHFGSEPFLVACDDHTDGGGWTVIQRRINGSVDFYRDWSEYKDGFGQIDGEFFIGMDKLNSLTTTLQPVELLIQLQDFNDTLKYAKYAEFHVGNETEKYILSKVGNYSGNAGDSLSKHEGHFFTTKDRNNDRITKGNNCAQIKKGAWWYLDCLYSNLNGVYYDGGKAEAIGTGICWSGFHDYNYSMKYVQMLIRPKRL